MSFDLESNPTHQFRDSGRYDTIEAANRTSFYLNNPHRSFDAYQSINSVGDERVSLMSLSEEASIATHAVKRFLAGGNMSTLGSYGPTELTIEERIADAHKNMRTFMDSVGVSETSVFVLRPNRNYSMPLKVVDVDTQETADRTDWPLRLDTEGDFIFTRDPNKALAVRPADCPVMIAAADTREGKLYMMVHYAWRGAANGHVRQTAEIFDSLGVDRRTLEVYLTPGGHAENFPYTNYPHDPRIEYPDAEGLFLNTKSRLTDKGEEVWDFGIDIPKFVYDQVLEHFDIDPTQVFCDTSDTSAMDSGYSSHSRSSRLMDLGESNTRDLVLAVFNNGNTA